MILFALLAFASNAQAVTPVATAKPASEEKTICRRMEPATGSNLPGKRVCRLQSVWATFDATTAGGVEAFRNRPIRAVGPSSLNQ